jgi:hypothetical protein
MIDMGPQAITRRLRAASAMADLRTDARLVHKLDMSARGITARLATVEQLRRLCLQLVGIGERNGLGRRK